MILRACAQRGRPHLRPGPGSLQLHPRYTGHLRCTPVLAVGIPRQIRPLPAGITKRVGRSRRPPGAANKWYVAGIYTFNGHRPGTLGMLV
jgi:hypothetical protein